MAFNQATTKDKPAAPTSRELAPIERLAPSRLPITQAMMTKLEVNEASWRTLTDTIFPTARTVEAIHLALSYCRSRNLDIMTKPVHIVPMYSSVLKRMVETVWPSIGLLRTTATRTGLWMGTDKKPEFGPEIEREFTDRYEDERDARNNRETKHAVKYPEWCTYTVYRHVMGMRCPFSATVRWEEAYATVSRNSDMPNEMWRKRAEAQLAKCAEAAALRMAFPEELGMSYAADEMEGRTIEAAGPVIEGEVVSTASQNPAGGKIQATQGGVRGAAATTGQSPVAAAPTIDLTAERDQTATAQAAALRAKAEQMASPSNETAKSDVAGFAPSNEGAKINMLDTGMPADDHVDDDAFDFEAFQKDILEAPDEIAVNAVCEGRKYDIYNRFIDDTTNMQIALKIKQRRLRDLRSGAVLEGAGT